MSARDLLDAKQNPVTVLRAERDGFENEQIEGAGQELAGWHEEALS
jgi:hypothetical protein